MMKARIFVPGETDAQTRELTRYIPEGFNSDTDLIYSGTGICLVKAAEIFKLDPDYEEKLFGDGERLEIKADGLRVIITEDNREIPLDQFPLLDQNEILEELFISDGCVILGSWSLLAALGCPDALPGTVWDVEINEDSDESELMGVYKVN